MFKIDLSRCKYPNIVAEMELCNVDFSEIGDVINTTAREAKSMLATGKKPLYLEHIERIARYFHVSDMGMLAKSELVTSQDGTPFKAVIIGLKQEALHQLTEIKQNDVELDPVQKRNLDRICNLLIKAEENTINYAEYRFFIDQGSEVEKIYKGLQVRKEMKALAAYIKEYPEDANAKLVEMFNIMDDRSRLMLFATAFNDMAVKAARKERAK